jgi:uncharacterized protein
VIVRSTFRPAWWLPGPHLQTLWAPLMRRPPALALRRERLELPDGDFLDLDWGPGESGPLVLVLHGLEGCSASPYVAGLADTLYRRGMRAVIMHFRGCSGEPNRLPRSYHSGDTGDLQWVLDALCRRAPGVGIAAVGYSLGGNVLLKWLGEQGGRARLQAAVAVSVPFDLHQAAWRLDRGFSRLYQWSLLRRLRASVRRKFAGHRAPVDLAALRRARSFRAFDHLVTAPLHGFASADDYYTRSSSAAYLRDIRVRTLILHAADDPFVTPRAIPRNAQLSPLVTLELAARGGHVGFVAGRYPWRAEYWLERRIADFLVAATAPSPPEGWAPRALTPARD